MKFFPACLALMLIARPSLAQCPLSKVTAPDAAEDDRFGWALDLAGDTLFVGAPLDNIARRNMGSVHVFRRDGLNWFLRSKLVAPDAQRGQTFGTELASDGRTLVVTASRAEFAGGDDPGALYVFEEHGGVFDYVTKLAPLGPEPNLEQLFGLELAVEGDWIFAGVPRDLDTGVVTGSVHVYHRTPAGWAPHGKLLAPSPVAGSLFGYSLAVDGDRLVVGAPADGTRAPRGGSLHIFERQGDAWLAREQLFPAVPRLGALFGDAVALAGNLLACGASADDERGSRAGAVHVFELLGGTWSESARLAPDILGAVDLLGGKVAIAADEILATAIGHGPNGAVFRFARTAGNWGLRSVVEPEDARDVPPSDRFGRSLAASGDLVAIGAASNDQRETDAGAVYTRCTTDRLCATLSSPREESWGKQRFELERGPAHAGHPYWLAGSMSGTSPGLRFRGQRIPLNLDGYFRALVQSPNVGWFTNNLGFLDGNGRARVDLRIPPAAYGALVGLTLHHAYMEIGPGESAHVSNAVPLSFGARR